MLKHALCKVRSVLRTKPQLVFKIRADDIVIEGGGRISVERVRDQCVAIRAWLKTVLKACDKIVPVNGL